MNSIIEPLASSLSSAATQLVHSNWGRLLATVALLALGAAVLKSIREAFHRAGGSLTERRERYVWMRNFAVGAGLMSLALLWGSSIAGLALSLAAVAGAVLLVSKEFIANVLGHLYFLLTRPFKVGDFIEIAGVKGRLTDVHVLALTMAETLEANQLTGRTVTIPSAMLLNTSVRNVTATGHYSIQMLHVAIDPRADILLSEQALLDAARHVCAPWLSEAESHLQSIEIRRLLDLPSAEPRVLIELKDSKTAVLTLRYACKTEERVSVEQSILRLYLSSGAHRAPSPAAAAQ